MREKTRKYRRSKRRFPTRVVKTGTKGTLVIGKNKAKEDIEAQLGRPLSQDAKECHTRFEWCWREAVT